MKTDQYTKIILTVIALNLSFISIKNLDIIPKAYANSLTTDSEIIPNTNYSLIPVNNDGSINVKLSTTDEIDVNIKSINTFDELDVNIEEIGGHSIHSTTIPVKVEEISNNNPIPVNIEEINAYSIYGQVIPVKVE